MFLRSFIGYVFLFVTMIHMIHKVLIISKNETCCDLHVLQPQLDGKTFYYYCPMKLYKYEQKRTTGLYKLQNYKYQRKTLGLLKNLKTKSICLWQIFEWLNPSIGCQYLASIPLLNDQIRVWHYIHLCNKVRQGKYVT